MALEFVPSSRGFQLLVLDGYTFNKKLQRDNKSYWICTQKDKCRAKCVITDGKLTSRPGQHSHGENTADIEKRKRINLMKNNARTTRDIPSRIVADATALLPEAVAGALPKPDLLNKMIRRVCEVQSKVPTNPTDLAQLQIPDEFTKTLAGEDFLSFDSGPGSDRILVFCTK